MASAKDRRKINQEAEAERQRRERERREFKEAQELESLRRAFKRMDKKGDGKLDVEELQEELDFLKYKVKRHEAELIIWEIDDDADGCVDWEEFRTMFYRIRDDTTGCEPRKLFNVVEFLMHDKNYNGLVDLDECVTLFYQRYGREAVDEKLSELVNSDDNDKNISFAKFVEIQRHAAKRQSGSGLKPGATMVPQVKGMAYVVDPTLSHLL
uniref:EF-hand domain-containing protein n=1 Tax=Chrysotila carterae TaxID=13221 RepID=A0A7S4AZU9_CHRCT|mmetsp:Transcript_2719/g.5789  ORF Transcript_2719/g.5789 Transcript_2719/m.5789 type:complete len:211 (+) Transcript_2719:248-880(+)